jgi:hypothetical protein
MEKRNEERIEPFMKNSFFWFNPPAYNQTVFDLASAPPLLKRLMEERGFKKVIVTECTEVGEDESVAIILRPGPDAEAELVI